MDSQSQITISNKRGNSTNRSARMTTITVRCVNILLRCLLGAVFLFAGFSKAGNPLLFSRDIAGYRLLPESIVNLMAVYLPYLEILIGITLLTRIFYSGGLILAGALLTIFVGAIASALIRGLDISCGCLGSASPSLPEAMTRNLVLIAAWIAVAWAFLKRTSQETAASEEQ